MSDSLRPYGQTIAFQVPLSMGFSKQKYWSGLPCPPPGNLPNPGPPHRRWILYHRSHQGSPRILEWVIYPFRGSSQPRNRTGVSWIAGRFFTSWDIREASSLSSTSNQLLSSRDFTTQVSLKTVPSSISIITALHEAKIDIAKVFQLVSPSSTSY